ncbi:MAG: hypothetical protein ABSE56_13410 [Bryobacteraceae bacterium]|jgi:hypothetical protein
MGRGNDESFGVILSNLAYIEKELPGLDMDEVLRQRLLSWCAEFRRDVTDLRSKIRVPREEAGETIHGQVEALHKLVMSLRELAAADPGCALLSVLIGESGANMLVAYREILDNLHG